MADPSDADDVQRLMNEVAGLQYSWDQLHALLHYRERNNVLPPHPPQALVEFLATVIPESIPEEQAIRIMDMVIVTFQWAQICQKNDVGYDSLLPCKCNDVTVTEKDFEAMYGWMKGH